MVLERLLPEKTRLVYPFGELVFPRWPLPPEVLAYLKSLEIPLPSARAKTEGIVAEAFSLGPCRRRTEVGDAESAGIGARLFDQR